MAKGTGRARPGAGTGGDRSCGGRRRAPVEDGNDDTLQEKFANDVREVRSDVGKRERPRGGGADHRGGRILKHDSGGSADCDEEIRRPGDAKRRGSKGKRERRSRDL